MSDEELKEWNLKLVILGDPAVGKTSLINKYVSASFKENYQPTLGVNIVIKDINIKNVHDIVRLTLWDIAGQDKYELTRNMFFQGAYSQQYRHYRNHKNRLLQEQKRTGNQNGTKKKVHNRPAVKIDEYAGKRKQYK